MVGHKFQYLLWYIVAGTFLNDYIPPPILFSLYFSLLLLKILCSLGCVREMPKPDKRDFEERYNACFVDFGIKIGTGLLIGSLLGGFFLRGYKKWPMYIGGGLGFGMAYTNCENSLNSFLLAMDPKACIIKKTP